MKPTTKKKCEAHYRTLVPNSLYFIWRERNARIHTSVARQVSVLIVKIKNLARLKLDRF